MTAKSIETSITIQNFAIEDAEAIIKRLEANGQFTHEAIEGECAMEKSMQYASHLFYVAKYKNEIVGVIRGTHEGYRTMIHLLAVHPDQQGAGIGRQLVDHFRAQVKARGGDSLSVTVSPEAQGFWQKLGFKATPITLMLSEN